METFRSQNSSRRNWLRTFRTLSTDRESVGNFRLRNGRQLLGLRKRSEQLIPRTTIGENISLMLRQRRDTFSPFRTRTMLSFRRPPPPLHSQKSASVLARRPRFSPEKSLIISRVQQSRASPTPRRKFVMLTAAAATESTHRARLVLTIPAVSSSRNGGALDEQAKGADTREKRRRVVLLL